MPRAAAELIQENRRRLRQKKVLGYRLKQKIRMPDRSLLQEKKQMRRQERGGALVAYFSWSGNTQAVAQEIQAQTGADLFEIVPAEPYTDDYDELLDIAQEEQSSDARPAIAETVDLSGYDTVYLGFPNWWGDMPMILYTFLDEHDLSERQSCPSIQAAAADFPVPLIPSPRWSRRPRSQKGFPLETERQRTAQMRCQSGLPISV